MIVFEFLDLFANFVQTFLSKTSIDFNTFIPKLINCLHHCPAEKSDVELGGTPLLRGIMLILGHYFKYD